MSVTLTMEGVNIHALTRKALLDAPVMQGTNWQLIMQIVKVGKL